MPEKQERLIWHQKWVSWSFNFECLCSVTPLILTRAPSWQTDKHSEAGGVERIGRVYGDKVGSAILLSELNDVLRIEEMFDKQRIFANEDSINI